MPVVGRTCAAAAVLSAGLVGCAGGGTWLVVEVTSDLRVPEELNQLEFHVEGLQTGGLFQARYDIGHPWPHSLRLRPGGADSEEVRITVTGLLDDQVVVQQVVSDHFEAGTSRLVRVELELACAGVVCAVGEVCRAGACIIVANDGGADAGPDMNVPDSETDAGGSDATDGGFDGVAHDAMSDRFPDAAPDSNVLDNPVDRLPDLDAPDNAQDRPPDVDMPEPAMDGGNPCGPGTQWCGSSCVDTSTDPGHCGACGNACGPLQTCVGGTCTGGAGGPPVFVNASVAQSGGTTSAFSFTHGVREGDNRLLVVGAALRSDSEAFTSVAYGGIPLTRIGGITGGGNARTELWYLVNPPPGMAVVRLNASASRNIAAIAMTFTGVDPTTPIGTPAQIGGSSISSSVSVTSSTDELVVDVVSSYNGTATMIAGPSQTKLTQIDHGGTDLRVATSIAPGASTVTMLWGLGGGPDHGQVAVSLRPAP